MQYIGAAPIVTQIDRATTRIEQQVIGRFWHIGDGQQYIGLDIQHNKTRLIFQRATYRRKDIVADINDQSVEIVLLPEKTPSRIVVKRAKGRTTLTIIFWPDHQIRQHGWTLDLLLDVQHIDRQLISRHCRPDSQAAAS